MDRLIYKDLKQRKVYLESFDKLFADMEKRAENERKGFIAGIPDKKELRNKYFAMLGYPLTTYKTDSDLNVKTDESFELNDMICTRYQLEVMPGFWFYGILYIEIGIDDVLFDYKSAEFDFDRLRKYAEDENCTGSLTISIFNGAHEIDTADEGIDFLIDNLINI